MFDRIVLVGAGRTSRSIVTRLARLAPLTILDTSEAALEQAAPAAGDDLAHRIVRQIGDGTSRLVLTDARGDPKSRVGLVLSPGNDRAALEATRLASELDFDVIVAVVNDRDAALGCEKLGARALLRAEIVGQLVEQSLQQAGLGLGSAGGFARGEILELTVLSSSPAIGVPLADLHAEGWRVAAIYRGSELVLPTGATKIAADDRLLVVGDPAQLPHVAERLRVGVPTFPLLHGPNVVVYLPDGRDDAIEDEAQVLVTRTRAARLIKAFPSAAAARRVVETPLPDGTKTRKHYDDAALEGDTVEAHLVTLRAKQPGVVVTKLGKRTFGDIVLGRGGRDAVLCNEISVPVIFPRGSPHHERIILCLTDGHGDLSAGEIALDLARMLSLPLLILRAKLPSFLEVADEQTERLLAEIVKRARLHKLEPSVQTLEGNPIDAWVRATQRTDLAIVSRRPSTRDSFSRPDIALRVARKAAGSVLVVTVKD